MRTGRWGAAALLAVLVACGGSGDSGDDNAAPEPAPAPTGGDLVTCDALIGMATADVLASGTCDDGTTTQMLGFAAYDCPDGRQLQWNDFGWGWSDGTWQVHARADGQLVPPDADMAACGQ